MLIRCVNVSDPDAAVSSHVMGSSEPYAAATAHPVALCALSAHRCNTCSQHITCSIYSSDLSRFGRCTVIACHSGPDLQTRQPAAAAAAAEQPQSLPQRQQLQQPPQQQPQLERNDTAAAITSTLASQPVFPALKRVKAEPREAMDVDSADELMSVASVNGSRLATAAAASTAGAGAADTATSSYAAIIPRVFASLGPADRKVTLLALAQQMTADDMRVIVNEFLNRFHLQPRNTRWLQGAV